MHPHTNLHTETFIPYMRDVARCEHALQELNVMWRMIEASAKMNCPVESKNLLPTIAATRSGFSKLEQELISSLVQEKVHTVLMEIATKAQYVIDIVVRNLFERTADVGFLATDQELCRFAAGMTDDQGVIYRRLSEYRSKYTVYDEIIILDTQGNVLVQIDPATPLEHSTDALLQETLESDTYVETFRASDLRPGKERALIYSRRMHHPETGNVIGVLCLCFHFEEEMNSIFTSHRSPDARFNMLMLDSNNRVIASADQLWIPVGTQVPANPHHEDRLMTFSGREYLVRTIASSGYQGYPGPTGWQGQVMIPIDIAFNNALSSVLQSLDKNITDGLLSHAHTFCPPLHDIMMAAKTIQRIVWNGQVMTTDQRGEVIKLKTILDQINETGQRSNDLFARSIHDLYQTVLTSSTQNAEFTTNLLVDLLDRNLYERANDCRWWALTPALRTMLDQPSQTADDTQAMTEILSYINSLYTVYTRLFVYDRFGKIIASTGLSEDDTTIGSFVDTDTMERVLCLRASQHYCVSPFEPSSLYHDAPTYIYHAAIRNIEGDDIVGGIGIVFDSTPELLAMLQSSLTEDSSRKAFYVNRRGEIISTTDSAYSVGDILDIDPLLFATPSGQSASQITTYRNDYVVISCTANRGYREFKISDGYQEDIIAIVIESYGEVQHTSSQTNDQAFVLHHERDIVDGQEFATFFTDHSLFAIAATNVVEAIPYASMISTSMGNKAEQIGILTLKDNPAHKDFVWVFDLGQLMRGTPSTPTASSQIIVVRHNQHTIGLLVDELHAVPEFDQSHITDTPFSMHRETALISKVIQANNGALLIQCIDISRLFHYLTEGTFPVPVELCEELLAA
jgi:chemotaxis signal transduction protein